MNYRLDREQIDLVDTAKGWEFNPLRISEQEIVLVRKNLIIYFCGISWSMQDRSRPHPNPKSSGCDYIEIAKGYGAAELGATLKYI